MLDILKDEKRQRETASSAAAAAAGGEEIHHSELSPATRALYPGLVEAAAAMESNSLAKSLKLLSNFSLLLLLLPPPLPSIAPE